MSLANGQENVSALFIAGDDLVIRRMAKMQEITAVRTRREGRTRGGQGIGDCGCAHILI